MSLWPQLRLRVRADKPLIITGHSLGVALAQLCALWCSQELNVPPYLILYRHPPSTGFKRSASGEAIPQNALDRHLWNLLWLIMVGIAFLFYLAFASHGIADY